MRSSGRPRPGRRPAWPARPERVRVRSPRRSAAGCAGIGARGDDVVGGLIVLAGAWLVITGLLARASSRPPAPRCTSCAPRSRRRPDRRPGDRRRAGQAGQRPRLTTGPVWALAGGLPDGGEPCARCGGSPGSRRARPGRAAPAGHRERRGGSLAAARGRRQIDLRPDPVRCPRWTRRSGDDRRPQRGGRAAAGHLAGPVDTARAPAAQPDSLAGRRCARPTWPCTSPRRCSAPTGPSATSWPSRTTRRPAAPVGCPARSRSCRPITAR